MSVEREKDKPKVHKLSLKGMFMPMPNLRFARVTNRETGSSKLVAEFVSFILEAIYMTWS